MKNTVYVLIVLLTIVHQDFWWWESSRLVFGFLPITLAYHACVSMAAAALWALAVKYCWPVDADVTESMTGAGSDGGQA